MKETTATKKNTVSKNQSEYTIKQKLVLLFSSNILSSSIGFLSVFVIARLYSVSVLGVYQLIVSLAGFLSVMSALKYDQAIMLPKVTRDRLILLIISFLISIAFILCYIVMSYFFDLNKLILNQSISHSYDTLIFFTIAASSFFLFARDYALSLNQYKQVSMAKVSQSVCFLVLILILALIDRNNPYLIIAMYVLSSVIATTYIVRSLSNTEITWAVFKKNAFKLVKKYRLLPQYELPWAFANQFFLLMPMLFISRYGSLQQLGLYALATRLIDAPIGIISGSYSNMFVRECAHNAAENKHKENLKLFFLCAKHLLFFTICIIACCLLLLYQPLCNLIFGSQWQGLGLVIILLAVGRLFRSVVSPLTSVFTVYGAQKISTIIGLIVMVVMFVALFSLKSNFYAMLIASSSILAIFYICYGFLVLYVIRRGKVFYAS